MVYISFKIAKIIVVVTIVEFCEGGAVGWGGVAGGGGRLILEERIVSRFPFQFLRTSTHLMSL